MKGQTSRTERSLNHIKMESLTGVCDRVHQVAILCIVCAKGRCPNQLISILHPSIYFPSTKDFYPLTRFRVIIATPIQEITLNTQIPP